MNQAQERRKWSARSLDRPASVFDIDGVLVDHRRRLEEAERRAGCRDCPEFWRYFLDPGLIEELDKPRMIGVRLAKKRVEYGYILVVVSGRPEKLRKVTLRQLRSLGLKPSLLLLRPRESLLRSPEAKSLLIEDLMYGSGVRIAEIHDDDPEALYAMGRVARKACLYLHTPDSYELLRSGACT